MLTHAFRLYRWKNLISIFERGRGGEERRLGGDKSEPLESTETYIELDCFGIHPRGHIYHNEGKSNVQLS